MLKKYMPVLSRKVILGNPVDTEIHGCWNPQILGVLETSEGNWSSAPVTSEAFWSLERHACLPTAASGFRMKLGATFHFSVKTESSLWIVPGSFLRPIEGMDGLCKVQKSHPEHCKVNVQVLTKKKWKFTPGFLLKPDEATGRCMQPLWASENF